MAMPGLVLSASRPSNGLKIIVTNDLSWLSADRNVLSALRSEIEDIPDTHIGLLRFSIRRIRIKKYTDRAGHERWNVNPLMVPVIATSRKVIFMLLNSPPARVAKRPDNFDALLVRMYIIKYIIPMETVEVSDSPIPVTIVMPAASETIRGCR